jgi:hypothetical protein
MNYMIPIIIAATPKIKVDIEISLFQHIYIKII